MIQSMVETHSEFMEELRKFGNEVLKAGKIDDLHLEKRAWDVFHLSRHTLLRN